MPNAFRRIETPLQEKLQSGLLFLSLNKPNFYEWVLSRSKKLTWLKKGINMWASFTVVRPMHA